MIQSSKTGGMGAGMAGNTALNTAFGGQGADKLLVKITSFLAVIFMTLAITLNILSTPGSESNNSINNSNRSYIPNCAINVLSNFDTVYRYLYGFYR